MTLYAVNAFKVPADFQRAFRTPRASAARDATRRIASKRGRLRRAADATALRPPRRARRAPAARAPSGAWMQCVASAKAGERGSQLDSVYLLLPHQQPVLPELAASHIALRILVGEMSRPSIQYRAVAVASCASECGTLRLLSS
jgi:hypothetical protein